VAEFEVTGGQRYKTTKMSVREQLKLLQNLGPLFPPLMQLQAQAASLGGEPGNVMAQPLLVAPFFEAFASMSEQELDRIVNRCFAVTRRGVAANGATVWGPPLWGGARDQYDDIGLDALFMIVWEVIMENLGGFFGIGTRPVPDPASIPTPTSPASPS
jgi:hypothetical protein